MPNRQLSADYLHLCRICGVELERDGCPNRLAHANAIREAGFTPETRGAPSPPGKGVIEQHLENLRLQEAIEKVKEAMVLRPVSVGDHRYNRKLEYVIEDLEALQR